MNVKATIVALFVLVLAMTGQACADFIIDMTTIGNPGNAADWVWEGNPSTPVDDIYMGAVSYVYQISTYEVSVAQYVTFLNAVAASDPHGLYHEEMGTGLALDGGAFIIRSGEDGSYAYTSVAGKESQPVRYVDFYDGLRLANWLHNGQGEGDTETGAYTLSLGIWLTREPGALWALASQDEWHKAAYYDPETGTYTEYPNGRDTIEYPADQTTPRELNFGADPWWAPEDPLHRQYFTAIGETTGRSAYGVSDMGGNVEEWTDSLVPPGQGWNRVSCGGSYAAGASYLARDSSLSRDPAIASEGQGFRLVYLGTIPEPSTVFLMTGGLLLLMIKRRHG